VFLDVKRRNKWIISCNIREIKEQTVNNDKPFHELARNHDHTLSGENQLLWLADDDSWAALVYDRDSKVVFWGGCGAAGVDRQSVMM